MWFLPIFTVIAGTNDDLTSITVAKGPSHANISKDTLFYKGYKCTETENDTTSCEAVDETMLENFLRSTQPKQLVFTHDVIANRATRYPDLREEYSLFRMPTSDDPKCISGDQHCPPMCVLLEMNYFGSVVAMKHAADDDDAVKTIRGRTYCGPMFGVVSKDDNQPVTSLETKPASVFPQARTVSVQYDPSTLAGVILPLADESPFPNWYYVHGYVGWRQAGPMKPAGLPCYGRNIPRWMLPNTCRFSSSGCVNGYSNYATHGEKKQYTHTLVDAASGGLNGRFINNTGYVDNGYNIDADRYVTLVKRDKQRKTFLQSCINNTDCTADMIANQYWNDPYYTIPATGLSAHSPFTEDWMVGNEIELQIPIINSKDPLEPPVVRSLTPPFTAETGVVVGIYSPMQTSHTAQSPVNSGQAPGANYETKLLAKYTPEGMYSKSAFITNGGNREFFHPLFEHLKSTDITSADTTYFPCISSWWNPNTNNVSTNTSKACWAYRTHDFGLFPDSYTFSTLDTPWSKAVADQVAEADFAASFINIEQAMQQVAATASHSQSINIPCYTQGFNVARKNRGLQICCKCPFNFIACTAKTIIDEIEKKRKGNASHANNKTALIHFFETNRVVPTHVKNHRGNNPCPSAINDLPTPTLDIISAVQIHFFKNNCAVLCKSSRKACFDQCATGKDGWSQYLITPLDVIVSYSSKWREDDRSGLGKLHGAKARDEYNNFNLWTTAKTYVDSSDTIITLQGKMLSHIRRQHAKISKKALKALMGTITASTGGMGAPVMAGMGFIDNTAAFDSHDYEETSVAEDVCDLTVCDIAIDHAPHKKTNKRDAEPFRCLPKSVATAIPYMSNTGYDMRFTSDGPDEFCIRGELDGSCLPNDEKLPTWYSWPKNGLVQNCVFDLKISQSSKCATRTTKWKSSVRIGVPSGSQTWKSIKPDYSNLVPHETHANPASAGFVNVPKDAGFSQRYHDENAYPCDCGPRNQGVELRMETVDTTTPFGKHMIKATYYNPKVHAVIRFSYAWGNSAGLIGPTVGLYLTSTSRHLEIVERDVFSRYNIMSPKTTYAAFLSPYAPNKTMGKALVYTRDPGNVEICPDISPHIRNTPCKNIRHETYAYEWVTTLAQSCARFPYGQLHRHQMSDALIDIVYPDSRLKDGTPNATTLKVHKEFTSTENKFTQTLQGYCESIIHEKAQMPSASFTSDEDEAEEEETQPPSPTAAPNVPIRDTSTGPYRFCPNDVMSAQERTDFCTQLLAKHFLLGLSIARRPATSSCVAQYKVCVLVPGYNTINAFTNKPDYAGYTFLVTPFEQLTLEYVYANRNIARVATEEKDNPYLLKDPDTYDIDDMEPLDKTDAEIGFTEDTESFILLSDLKAWVSSKSKITTPKAAIDAIVIQLTKFTKDVYKSCTTKANKDGITITSRVNIEDEKTKTCASSEYVFPANTETNIEVTQPDITIRPATTTRELKFGGQMDEAVTCNRFIVSAPGFVLADGVNIDQTGCRQPIDPHYLTAIKYYGKNVSNSCVNITTAGTPLPITLLGDDMDNLGIPTTLVADNMDLTVTLGNTIHVVGDDAFHIALARVNSTRIKVNCGTAPCAILTQPGKETAATLVEKFTAVTCANITYANAPAAALCTFVDISAYIGIFGAGFERMMQLPVHSYSVVAYTIFVVMTITASAITILIISMAFDKTRNVKVAIGIEKDIAPPVPSALQLKEVDCSLDNNVFTVHKSGSRRAGIKWKYDDIYDAVVARRESVNGVDGDVTRMLRGLR